MRLIPKQVFRYLAMDFSFIAHHFQQSFGNVTISVTDEAYVYSSKVSENSKFMLELSKKFDCITIELETGDESFRQRFRFDEKLKALNLKSANFGSILVPIIQNLGRVSEWAGKRITETNLLPVPNRPKFINEEFERLERLYGEVRPQVKNYFLIEGEGSFTKFPPGLGIAIFSSPGKTFVSNGKMNDTWEGDTPKVLQLIGWWFHRNEVRGGEVRGGGKEVSFEEWQKLPLKGFGLPEAPPVVATVTTKPHPIRTHSERFDFIFHRATAGKMPANQAQGDSYLKNKLGNFKEVRDWIVKSDPRCGSLSCYNGVTSYFATLLREQGYVVTGCTLDKHLEHESKSFCTGMVEVSWNWN